MVQWRSAPGLIFFIIAIALTYAAGKPVIVYMCSPPVTRGIGRSLTGARCLPQRQPVRLCSRRSPLPANRAACRRCRRVRRPVKRASNKRAAADAGATATALTQAQLPGGGLAGQVPADVGQRLQHGAVVALAAVVDQRIELRGRRETGRQCGAFGAQRPLRQPSQCRQQRPPAGAAVGRAARLEVGAPQAAGPLVQSGVVCDDLRQKGPARGARTRAVLGSKGQQSNPAIPAFAALLGSTQGSGAPPTLVNPLLMAYAVQALMPA